MAVIITLYSEHNEVNYYSCVVSQKVYDNILLLANMGGFKRFSVDYEDDTDKPLTDLKEVFKTFLCKVLPNVNFNIIKKQLE